MNHFKIYRKESLLVVKIERPDLDSLKKLFLEAIQHEDYHKDLDGIYDFRGIDFNYTKEELIELSLFIEKGVFTNGLRVILNDMPKERVVSMIESYLFEHSIKVEVCSSVEKASFYLGLDLEKYLT